MIYQNIETRNKGLIFLGIGAIHSLILFIPIFPVLPQGISLILVFGLGFTGLFGLIPVGLGFIYQSLVDRWRGIMSVSIGAVPFSLSLLLIFVIPLQPDSFFIILLLDTLFFVFTFFLTGFLKIIWEIQFGDIYGLTYSIAPVTTLGLLIYAIIIAAVFPLAFLNYFLEWLILAFPLSLFIAHILFCYIGTELDMM